jgi:hypothetical protein
MSLLFLQILPPATAFWRRPISPRVLFSFGIYRLILFGSRSGSPAGVKGQDPDIRSLCPVSRLNPALVPLTREMPTFVKTKPLLLPTRAGVLWSAASVARSWDGKPGKLIVRTLLRFNHHL